MKIRCPKFIKRIFKRLFRPAIRLYEFSKEKVIRSIRMELVVAFVVCLLASFIASGWYNSHYTGSSRNTVIDYSNGINSIENQCSRIKRNIEQKSASIKDESLMSNIVNNEEANNNENETIKILITDLNGKVLYKSKNAEESQVSIHDLINKTWAYKSKYDNYRYISENGTRIISLDKVSEYVELGSVNFSDGEAYVIVKGIPHGETTHIKTDSSFFSIVLAIAVFIMLFYLITNKKMKYIEGVSEGLFEIARGNLDSRICIQGKDELAKLAGNINFMAKELERKIENERNAEKTKSDLITNVSHDLRTPLTSIKGYLGLVKDRKYKNGDELQEYLNIAYNKSEKLEVLINDLFEYTKLTNKGINLNKQNISFNGLLEQLIEELYVICEENNVVIKKNIPNEKICAHVDGDKMVRVFENLLMNSIRYSPKPGEINVSLYKDNGFVVVSIKNKCENVNEEELKKIFDRFYRVDKSRSGATGGSGLGLAIAKSIVELHGGEIWAEINEKNIIFFVKCDDEKCTE
ncbi:GHKL domain-containing protein [Clostridium sp. P21]|uniref:histidine kinase n=1 Tax=Clostridium muellerianum TaxID=2716538 RepID=A0A7Y0EI92_9CLOT|nr:ATP-binding protein [Clostridium muellerianum]NMM63965.1 GHKL domain-containing protein [Clostridium muellerianum]